MSCLVPFLSKQLFFWYQFWTDIYAGAWWWWLARITLTIGLLFVDNASWRLLPGRLVSDPLPWHTHSLPFSRTWPDLFIKQIKHVLRATYDTFLPHKSFSADTHQHGAERTNLLHELYIQLILYIHFGLICTSLFSNAVRLHAIKQSLITYQTIYYCIQAQFSIYLFICTRWPKIQFNVFITIKFPSIHWALYSNMAPFNLISFL